MDSWGIGDDDDDAATRCNLLEFLKNLPFTNYTVENLSILYLILDEHVLIQLTFNRKLDEGSLCKIDF